MSIYESRKPKSSSDDHISQPPKTSTFKPPVVQTQSVEAEPPMPVYRSIIDDFLTNNPFQQVPGEPASGQRRLSPIRIPSVSAEVQRQELVQLNPLKGAAKADEALELAQKELFHLNREMALEMAQAAADLAGIVDPTPISDSISAAISLAKGDYLGAGLSLVSIVPFIGDALGKPLKAASNVKKIEHLKQRIEELTTVIQQFNPSASEHTIEKAKRVSATIQGILQKIGSESLKMMPKHKIINTLESISGHTFSVGSDVLVLTKERLKHILERHHPEFRRTASKDMQTFFVDDISIDEIFAAIEDIIKQNREKLIQNGVNNFLQIDGFYNGCRYKLGIRGGKVVQFFPQNRRSL
ncbi:hypothetical protein [Anthocerotibacter panamensis]|uniref:hypothetical protein n=1 Tax=Anthocerotibacter panamensis TaxID=2857077 RepID=UPI001C407EE9|nr:hypothetical protein [Anthocerotibacter panamensis]